MGAPTISGTLQVGQTLTADTSAITDTDGLTGVSYAYQWIQVATDNTETDISGAMASTYILLAGDLGKTIKVKVTFTDDANNAETLTSVATTTVAAAGTDTIAPTLVSASVPAAGSGAVIDLVFSEDLSTNKPYGSDFRITADGIVVGFTSRTIAPSGTTNTIRTARLPVDIRQGQAVVVTYTDPTGGNDVTAIQDLAGNDAASFTTGRNGVAVVINNSALAPVAPDAPTGLSAITGGPATINLSWTAPADNGGRVISGYKIEASSDGGVTFTTVATTSSAATRYAHTGLAAETTRHYRVSAINTIGTGNASNIDGGATGVPDTIAPLVDWFWLREPSVSPSNENQARWLVQFTEAVQVDATDFVLTGTTAEVTVADAVPSFPPGKRYSVSASGGDLATVSGTIALDIAAGHNIEDTAGNAMTDTTPVNLRSTSFVLDNLAPTVTITDVPSASSAAFTATFTFSEAVTGFAADDITLGNAVGSAVTATSATVYTQTIMPTVTGTVTLDVAANGAQDTAGNGNTVATRASSTYTQQGADITAPVLVTAQVDGERLTLTYHEALDTGSEPAPGDFSVGVARQTAPVSGVALSGSALTLTLARAVVNGEAVTVTYTAGSAPIRDLAGNGAADISFPGRAVDNVTVSPPGAPGRLTAISGNGQVSLGWAPPSSDGGVAIVRYEYRVSPDGGNNWSPDWSAVPDGPDAGNDAADERAYVVTGLANGTAYTFEVRASNSTHSGPAAQAAATPRAGPAADPDAPRGFTARAGDAAVSLSWQAPLNTGNRPLLRYEVRYARGSTLSAGVSWQDAGAVQTYTVTGLANGRRHTFEVRAVNTANRASAAVRAQALPGAIADAPGNLRAVSGAPYVGNGNGIDVVPERAYVDVTLSWDAPPADGADPILRYETRHRAGSAAWTAYRQVDGLMATVTRLTPGTGYTFELRAVSGAGPGAPASRQLTTAQYTGAAVTLQAGAAAREGEPFTLQATRSGSTAADTYVFFELYDSAFPNGYRGGTRYHHEVAYFNGAGTTATATYTPPFDDKLAARTFTVRISDVKGKYDIAGGLVTVSVVDRDADLRVADAGVREGAGATLEFEVTLDRARDRTVTVEYATSAGTATAGLDYTHVSGTLSIPAGSRRASIEVPVLDDQIDDDGETLTLTLSNAVGAFIEDGVATGTIRNTDALPKAWLGRFGRSAAVQVVTLLDERFEAAAGSDTRLVLGGRAVDVAALRTAAPWQAPGTDTTARERPVSGCAAEAGKPQAPRAGACDTADRAPLLNSAGAAPARYGEGAVRLDDQAGTFGQPGRTPSTRPSVLSVLTTRPDSSGNRGRTPSARPIVLSVLTTSPGSSGNRGRTPSTRPSVLSVLTTRPGPSGNRGRTPSTRPSVLCVLTTRPGLSGNRAWT